MWLGVPAFGGPGLVFPLTVVPKSYPHAFCEQRQAVAVPFLWCVAGEAEAGAATLVCRNRDLMHQVAMLWPARRDDAGSVPDVFVVQPGDDSLQPGPDLSRRPALPSMHRARWAMMGLPLSARTSAWRSLSWPISSGRSMAVSSPEKVRPAIAPACQLRRVTRLARPGRRSPD